MWIPFYLLGNRLHRAERRLVGGDVLVVVVGVTRDLSGRPRLVLRLDRLERRVDVVAYRFPLRAPPLEPTAAGQIDRVGDRSLNFDVFSLAERIGFRRGPDQRLRVRVDRIVDDPFSLAGLDDATQIHDPDLVCLSRDEETTMVLLIRH